jgi:DNA-binding response OmpR family regulator
MNSANLLRGKRILLVDDEPDILDTLEDLLCDCETVKAGSYREALQRIDSETFDIAVLDVMGVDGFKLLEHCVAKDLTAVMLTARAQTRKDVVRSFKKGAAYFIPKEEMASIETFLEDILSAQNKGQNTWVRWYDRLSVFGQRVFDSEFEPEDEDFLNKLIKY